MLLPISLLWIHIILLIFLYLTGRTLSKLVEPIPVDNIIKEVHNKNFPITSIITVITINIIALLILKTDYVPSLQTLKLLSTSIQETITIRITYLLIHSLSFLLLQPTIKFVITPEYKHKVLSKITLLVVIIGILHFTIFLGMMIYIILTI